MKRFSAGILFGLALGFVAGYLVAALDGLAGQLRDAERQAQPVVRKTPTPRPAPDLDRPENTALFGRTWCL